MRFFTRKPFIAFALSYLVKGGNTVIFWKILGKNDKKGILPHRCYNCTIFVKNVQWTTVYPATRIIRHKILVPWIFLSLAIHAARFIRFARFIRHKISVPWSKNHCHLHGLSGFYFSTQFEVDHIFTDVILYWWIYCFKGYYFSVSTHFPLIVDYMQWLEVLLFYCMLLRRWI